MHQPTRFQEQSYYEILHIIPSAPDALIKTAYRRAALKYHPDHNTSNEATEEFQFLVHVQSVLLNPNLRQKYDKHGHAAFDKSSDDDEEGWDSEHLHTSLNISFDDIEAFKQRYINSEDEKADIMEVYRQYPTEIYHIFECVPFADNANFNRIIKILQKECKTEFSPKLLAHTQKKVAKLEEQEAAEASEAEELLKEIQAKADKTTKKNMKLMLQNYNSGDKEDRENALITTIQSMHAKRKNDFDSMIGDMEARYGQKKVKTKKVDSKSSSTKTKTSSKGRK
jgi:curved DNA-binding protein CbpA